MSVYDPALCDGPPDPAKRDKILAQNTPSLKSLHPDIQQILAACVAYNPQLRACAKGDEGVLVAAWPAEWEERFGGCFCAWVEIRRTGKYRFMAGIPEYICGDETVSSAQEFRTKEEVARYILMGAYWGPHQWNNGGFFPGGHIGEDALKQLCA